MRLSEIPKDTPQEWLDAYDRAAWARSDTLDPELRLLRIPLSLLIALCIRVGRPVRRAA